MSALPPCPLWVHESARLAAFENRLRQFGARGELPNDLHYRTQEQARLWLDVTHAHAPVYGVSDIERFYRRFFASAAVGLAKQPVNTLVALGSGTALKESWVAEILLPNGPALTFVAADINPELVLLSLERGAAVGCRSRHGLVADVAALEFLSDWLAGLGCSGPRLITYFGMLVNARPSETLPRLRDLMRAEDRLLINVNLAPADGDDPDTDAFERGCRAVLPQYDNPATRTWLQWAIKDRGWQDRLQPLRFRVAPFEEELFAIVAECEPLDDLPLVLPGEVGAINRNESLRVFTSVRFSLKRTERLFAKYGLTVLTSDLSGCGSEAVWLVQRSD